MDFKFNGNRVEITPPKSTRKITGTRFAAIFGANAWTTPFNTWCDITKLYKEPFEDTIYTIAGKTIEPKQADYMERAYNLNIVRPEDWFGPEPFKTTFGDFFKDELIFGGMWDYLVKDENGDVVAVIECKTSKRSEDWVDDIPEYYALQAALYCHLLRKKYPKCTHVFMVATFLQAKDYEHPENFVVSADNTIVRPFSIDDRYPEFADMITDAEFWWTEHITKGISPEFDEKADADILKALRNVSVDASEGFDDLIKEAEELKDKIDEAKKAVAEDEKRYKKITDAIKAELTEHLNADESAKTAELAGGRFTFVVSRGSKEVIDKDALKSDGLFDKYVTNQPSFTLRVKENK